MINPIQSFRHLMAPQSISDIPAQCRRTQTLSIWEGCLWALMWGLGESYIAPYALYLGAGNLMMAFVGTGPVLITALAQLFGAVLLDRVGSRKPVIFVGMAIQALAFIPLFLLPLLLPTGGMCALMICITVYFLFFGISVPPWQSLIGDVVEPAERGRFFSGRTRIVMVAMTTALMLAGMITNSWEAIGLTVVGFGFVFSIAAFARIISMVFMKHHYDAPLERTPQDVPYSFWTFLREARKANFGRFTFTIALMNGTAAIAGPFFAVYMLRDLEWSYLQFTFNMLMFLSAQAVFVPWWGNVSDRHGNRSVLVATSCLLPLLPLFWVFSTQYLVLLLAQIISGATWSGFNLAATNFIYDSVPQIRRARAFSYYSLINGVFSVLGGMIIGAYVAEHAPAHVELGLMKISLLSSIPVVFIVSAIARAIAAAIMLPQFSEVRETEPISTARLLWQLTSGQPLFGQVGGFMLRMRTLLPPKTK